MRLLTDAIPVEAGMIGRWTRADRVTTLHGLTAGRAWPR